MTTDTGILSSARSAFERRDFAKAIRLLERGIADFPDSPSLHIALGAVLQGEGNLEGARTVLESAIALDPDSAIAHSNLGVVLAELGQFNTAVHYQRIACRLSATHANHWANLGIALGLAGKPGQAIRALREAVRLDSGNTLHLVALGDKLLAGDHLKQAESCYRDALACNPEATGALIGLARTLSRLGRHDEARRVSRKVLRVSQQAPEAVLLHGEILTAGRQDNEALSCYRQLLASGSQGPRILGGMAAVLGNLGRARESIKYYQQALALAPGDASLRSAYFFQLRASSLQPEGEIFAELNDWDRYHAPEPRSRCRLHPRKPVSEKRKLRIGYLSPDFRMHVVRQFFEPVLYHHDPDNVEVYCYSEATQLDFATETIRAVADRWYSTNGVSDKQVARQINRDRIDILVDLAGHTANNRLGVMARRPAPVQATYLGFFGSTGLSAIDYWITDYTLHPEGTPERSSETIYRLPRCSFAYGVPTRAPINPDLSLQRSITFGCFNNVTKVSSQVLDTWAEILRRCPRTRLVLKDRAFGAAVARRNWQARFERRGIARERVDIEDSSPHGLYMAQWNRIDIALDPFPRTGGTTTCDALWMGVPVITLAGGAYVERLSTTKLRAIGAGELVTESREDYVALAIRLARDPERCVEYKRSLRTTMANSDLCDASSLAAALESAYRHMLDGR